MLEGEYIESFDHLISTITEVTDEAINEKYIKGEIRIVTEQARYPLDTISSITSSDKYKLNPEYQRRHRWSNDKKSRLIESLIMNVPIPPVFLYEYDYSKYEVMDGLQRLSTIDDFYKDKFALEGLDQWPELNGKRYSTLPEKVKEGIDRRYLSSVILLRETAKSEDEAIRLKQMVFERINSGGEKLQPQESRNALIDGPMNRLCMKLSLNKSLCRLWGIPEPSDAEINEGASPSVERAEYEMYRRMEDVELVLRFFAYRQKNRLHKGGKLSSYFDNYLRNANKFPANTLEEMSNLFTNTIQAVEEILGDQAFWLYRKKKNADNWYWYSRPTLMVYDSLMLAVSHALQHKAALVENKDNIKSGLEEFYKTNYDIFEGRDVNPSTLSEKDRLMQTFINSYV